MRVPQQLDGLRISLHIIIHELCSKISGVQALVFHAGWHPQIELPCHDDFRIIIPRIQWLWTHGAAHVPSRPSRCCSEDPPSGDDVFRWKSQIGLSCLSTVVCTIGKASLIAPLCLRWSPMICCVCIGTNITVWMQIRCTSAFLRVVCWLSHRLCWIKQVIQYQVEITCGLFM